MYFSHLLPVTLPHVKHLTGMIIFVFWGSARSAIRRIRDVNHDQQSRHSKNYQVPPSEQEKPEFGGQSRGVSFTSQKNMPKKVRLRVATCWALCERV
jgi:hypothetical protein